MVNNSVQKLVPVLTSAGEEDLDGDVLEEVAAGEDGAHLREVPLAVEVVTVLEHLQQNAQLMSE